MFHPRLTPTLLSFSLFAPVSVNADPCDSLSAQFDAWPSGLTVQFDVTDPLPDAQYTWIFGDGTSGTGADPDHAYGSSGSYQVCVIAAWLIPGGGPMDSCFADHCEWVTVSGGGGGSCDSLSAEFSWVTAGLGVQFEINAPLVGAQYEWTFGDGADGSGVDPDHVYSTGGAYQVCVIATWVIPGTLDTCVVDHCEWVTVITGGSLCDGLLEAAFEWEDIGGNAAHFFDISYSSIGTPEYFWWFDDGTTSDASDPVHTFPASGSYIVCLTINATIPGTMDTCSSTVCDTVLVGPEMIPTHGTGEVTLHTWPQPAGGVVMISGGDFQGMVNIIILDSRGCVVASTEAMAQVQIPVDLRGLTAGVYSLLASDARSVWRARLMKE